ncbi:DNA-binding LacI/PurR family transcriptional regulator [Amycolatopsis jiangsuensis]|uniref:DNA-binding LacI/PurR family transcriptional regulator n=1 Tax=Amycolatopsis jiangsuensis TaxID=1181879 RepID=A0A840IMC0_9PSEU|nr:DNA-binding LacI/PurR family transcriptional regulator [Amycolatopsis jiangsuensis]
MDTSRPGPGGDRRPARETGSGALSRAAGIKDVAAAGGSLGTVSNVLDRPDRVSPRTRAWVEAAMAELRFVRNESARQLRARHSRFLAYVMLDGHNPFCSDVAAGMEEAADEASLSLFMCNSANLAEREAAYLHRLEQQRVQGILITPVDLGSPGCPPPRPSPSPPSGSRGSVSAVPRRH